MNWDTYLQHAIARARVPFSQRITKVWVGSEERLLNIRSGRPLQETPHMLVDGVPDLPMNLALTSSVNRFTFAGRKCIKHTLCIELTDEALAMATDVASSGGVCLQFVRRVDGEILIVATSACMATHRYLWIGSEEDIPEADRDLVKQWTPVLRGA